MNQDFRLPYFLTGLSRRKLFILLTGKRAVKLTRWKFENEYKLQKRDGAVSLQESEWD